MNFQIEEKFIPDKALQSYKKALELLQQENPTEAGFFLIDIEGMYGCFAALPSSLRGSADDGTRLPGDGHYTVGYRRYIPEEGYGEEIHVGIRSDQTLANEGKRPSGVDVMAM